MSVKGDGDNTPKNNEETLKTGTSTTNKSQSFEEISIYDTITPLKRRLLLAWASFSAMLWTIGDAIYLPGMHTIVEDLKTTDGYVTLTVSEYIFFSGIGSPIWGVVADKWGRSIAARAGLILFIGTSIACIFATNVWSLLAFRTLEGLSVASTMIIGQAIIADIYRPEERGKATGIFFVPFLLGVVIGPTIGGLVTYFLGWRSTFIVLIILAAIILVAHVFLVPETHHYKVMMKLSNKIIIERDTIKEPRITNPFSVFLYLADWTVLPYITTATTAYASLIVNQSLLSIILARPPISELIGSLIGGWISDKGIHFFKNQGPIIRILPGIFTFLLVPIGILLYGWGVEAHGTIVLPIVGAVLVAFGQAAFRPAVYSYLTVKEQQAAASIASANNFLNASFAAILLGIAIPAIRAIDIGVFFSLISALNFLALIATTVCIFLQIRLFRRTYQPLP